MPEFDLRTHTTDQLTGVTKATNLYRLHVIDKVQLFERPVNSGNLWYRNNEPAGRLVGGKQDPKAPHIEYTPPPTGAERLATELRAAQEQAEAVKRELEAIKATQKAAIEKVQKQTERVPEKDKA
jgi:hypothetical protein